MGRLGTRILDNLTLDLDLCVSRTMYSTLLLIFLYSSPWLIQSVGAVNVSSNLIIRKFSPTVDPSPIPTQSPIILVNDFSSVLSTCVFHDVTWSYGGPTIGLTLVATNFGVPQDPPPPSFSVRPTPTFSDGGLVLAAVPSGASQVSTVTSTIVEGFEPHASSVPWKVNVPPGWYQISATMESQFQDQSDAFYVQAGTDTSCLIGGPLPSSSSSSSTGSSISLSPSVTPSTAPGGNFTPLSSSHNSTSSHAGVIAGAVAGVTAVMCFAAFCYIRRRRSKFRPLVRGDAWGVLAEPFEPDDSAPNGLQRGLQPRRRSPSRVTPLKLRGNNRRQTVLSDNGTDVSSVEPHLPSQAVSTELGPPSYGGMSAGPPPYSSTQGSCSP